MKYLVIKVVLYFAFAATSVFGAVYAYNFGALYLDMSRGGPAQAERFSLWAYGYFTVSGFFLILGVSLFVRALFYIRNRNQELER
jgi:hypothetical protein